MHPRFLQGRQSESTPSASDNEAETSPTESSAITEETTTSLFEETNTSTAIQSTQSSIVSSSSSSSDTSTTSSTVSETSISLRTSSTQTISSTTSSATSSDPTSTSTSETTDAIRSETSTSMPTSSETSTSPTLISETSVSPTLTSDTSTSSQLTSSILGPVTETGTVPNTTVAPDTITATPTDNSIASIPASFSLSDIVITVNGTALTTTTPVPTSLSSAPPPLSPSKRAAIIAGSTLGAIGLIIMIILFLFSRHKHKKLGFLHKLSNNRQEQANARARLLDGEDMEDDASFPMTTQYRDHPHDVSDASSQAAGESPRLFRQRGSETGSIFHEGVWPPPGEDLVDPFAVSSVDLGLIVTNTMGSPSTDDLTDDRVASPGLLRVLNRTNSSASQDSLVDTTSETPQAPLLPPTSPAKRPSPLANEVSSIDTAASQTNWITRSPRKNPSNS